MVPWIVWNSKPNIFPDNISLTFKAFRPKNASVYLSTDIRQFGKESILNCICNSLGTLLAAVHKDNLTKTVQLWVETRQAGWVKEITEPEMSGRGNTQQPRGGGTNLKEEQE